MRGVRCREHASGGLSEPEGTAQLSFTVAGPVERAGALHAEESCTSRWCSGCVFRAFLPCDQRAHSEEASERGGRRDARTWREEMAWRSVGLTGSECLRRTWCHPHLVVSGALRLAQDTSAEERSAEERSAKERSEEERKERGFCTHCTSSVHGGSVRDPL